MNNLEEAAALLENGWCIGELVEHHPEDPPDKDRYCAIGAVATQMDILVTMEYTDDDGYGIVDDLATYKKFNETAEGAALAATIIDSDWMKAEAPHRQRSMLSSFENMDYDEVVFEFNDAQTSSEPVIEMFKLAAQRLDAKA